MPAVPFCRGSRVLSWCRCPRPSADPLPPPVVQPDWVPAGQRAIWCGGPLKSATACHSRVQCRSCLPLAGSMPERCCLFRPPTLAPYPPPCLHALPGGTTLTGASSTPPSGPSTWAPATGAGATTSSRRGRHAAAAAAAAAALLSLLLAWPSRAPAASAPPLLAHPPRRCLPAPALPLPPPARPTPTAPTTCGLQTATFTSPRSRYMPAGGAQRCAAAGPGAATPRECRRRRRRPPPAHPGALCPPPAPPRRASPPPARPPHAPILPPPATNHTRHRRTATRTPARGSPPSPPPPSTPACAWPTAPRSPRCTWRRACSCPRPVRACGPPSGCSPRVRWGGLPSRCAVVRCAALCCAALPPSDAPHRCGAARCLSTLRGAARAVHARRARRLACAPQHAASAPHNPSLTAPAELKYGKWAASGEVRWVEGGTGRRSAGGGRPRAAPASTALRALRVRCIQCALACARPARLPLAPTTRRRADRHHGERERLQEDHAGPALRRQRWALACALRWRCRWRLAALPLPLPLPALCTCAALLVPTDLCLTAPL